MTAPFSLEGCVAVVTGGNGALGSALAKGLGSAGARARAPEGVRAKPAHTRRRLRRGFFVADQNRGLLLDEEGGLTARGHAAVEHTPAGRFGEPGALVTTLLLLCSPASRFVTGAVVPVDGGFGAFGGI